jgi:hypothetical protein
VCAASFVNCSMDFVANIDRIKPPAGAHYT